MAFIFITLVVDILGLGIVVPVLPMLIKQLAGGEAASAGHFVGLISASYAITQFLCAPLLGALSDRFGRRPVILAALCGLGVDYVIQGMAPSLAWLFVGRVIAGAMGASYTAANAYIADVSTVETRARNFGLVGVAFGLGFIFGPALGGILGGIHLRLPFFVAAGLALLNCLYGLFVLPESLPREERSSFSLRRNHPLASMRRLRAYPLVAGLAMAFVLASLAHRGLESVWVLYTQARYGWDEKTNGLVLALVGLMATIVQGGLIRPIIAQVGERTAVIAGLGVAAVTFLGYGLASRGWMILPLIALGSLGGISGPAIQAIIAGEIPPSEQGKVQGALTSLVSLTNIAAPLIFTAGLFAYFASQSAPAPLPGAPFLVGAVLFALSLVVVVRLFRRIPEVHAAHATPAPPQSTE
ncbi:MAG: TCR/Tet family MFS transporter [Candidatus Schekmanbacteria bacterium]|nr:TCR/Tet family MFS transporter [Candidatus Schekmanbacteria bacterium]